MKRQILALMLIGAFALLCFSAFGQAKKTEKAEDPVCHMMVDKDPDLSATFKGETYYFCSKKDMEEFKKTPEKYAKKK